MGEVVDFKAGLTREVRGAFDAPTGADITRIPFPVRMETAARRAVEIARDTDRKRDGIERAIRAAKEALEGCKRRQVHPDLHKALSARLEGAASLVRGIAPECQLAGHPAAQTTLLDLADILETLSAEVLLHLEEV